MPEHSTPPLSLIFDPGCILIKKLSSKMKFQQQRVQLFPKFLFVTFVTFMLLLLSSVLCFGNKIDELKTPEDVLKFIKMTLNKEESFQAKPKKPGAIDFNFIKLDLNKDGMTDILVNGKYLYAVIDNDGQNNFKEIFIGDSYFDYELLSVDSTGKLPMLTVQKENDYDRYSGKEIKVDPDTLVIKFGGFIEFNSLPKQIDFKEIKITTTACFGTCPVFELTISKNRQAILTAKKYNRLNGIYKAVIDSKTFEDLTDILSYVNIDSLKNSYAIGWTDNPAIDIQIQYNGLTKNIHDYGLKGTFGLKRLYEVLYAIKDTEDWE